MSRHQQPNSGRRRGTEGTHFEPIQELLSGKVLNGRLVSVVGAVQDYQLPFRTKGPGEAIPSSSRFPTEDIHDC